MNLLIAFTDGDTHNPFVKELQIGLENAGCAVTWSLSKFWQRKGSFDIIHLQWPEYLFDSKSDLNQSMLISLEETLEFWHNSAKIVVTRHNETPHSNNSSPIHSRLYDLVYKYSDGVIHLGPYEILRFKKQYKSIKYHTIIPHHIYTHSYRNNIPYNKARKHLKITEGSNIVLIIGSIRHYSERQILKKLIKTTRQDNIKFIIPTWFPAFHGSGIKALLKRIYYVLRLAILNLNKNLIASNQFVSDEELQVLINASDIIAIPRVKSLNSGIPTLSFLFKKVVVGPNHGNIGIDLAEFGNPVYSRDSISSFRDAIMVGLDLSKKGHGMQNFKVATQTRTPTIVGKMHIQFYCHCLNKS